MKAAIYSRKSKFTGKGDSVENQVQMCKEYAKIHGITSYIIYEDEGFSGGTTNRPMFQKMLKDARTKKFNMLICYRLDRISRNIADFARLIEELQEYNIDFISIREQFDTSTPMGRAMMNIAAVFAQLERETIAERIRDNMLELSKSGHWLGGQAPLGYTSKKITYLDEEFKQRNMYQLSSVQEELQTVKLIFNKYLETKSLSQVSKYLLSNHIKGKNGGNLSKKSIHNILTNPVYVKANNKIFDYLQDLGVTTAGKPNGEYGILTYNKNQKGKKQDFSQWIAAIGKHKGIIHPNHWLFVQEILKVNKEKAPRIGTSHTALLTGILKCGKCGSGMRVTYGNKIKGTNLRTYYYTCSLKNNSGKTRCDNKNVRGDELEKIVIKKLKAFNKGTLLKELKEIKKKNEQFNTHSHEIISINNQINTKKSAIQNLIKQLSENENSMAASYLIREIEKLDKECKQLEKKLEHKKNIEKVSDEKNINIDLIIHSLENFNALFDTLKHIDDKRTLISCLARKITWDGMNGHVKIFLWGSPQK
ncbi:recombinase family protein [Crassaminicella profunda]|uniref:recombinase family protein n=1 Tax=Crassaminicella profunda TaxID=1286698 RepID=UPI001CA650F7|nr:recombinase family protein [Crassaminicella profunda]QZY56854.1 recombinase family protein [Crassaminicella profunda]